MGQPGKVSGRGGWKTTKFVMAGDRELNKREKTQYEKCCEYCQRVCNYPGPPEHIWYVVSQSIPSH